MNSLPENSSQSRLVSIVAGAVGKTPRPAKPDAIITASRNARPRDWRPE
jgi:hypothetical protein